MENCLPTALRLLMYIDLIQILIFSELDKKSLRVFLCLVFPAEFCSLAGVKIDYFLKIT